MAGRPRAAKGLQPCQLPEAPTYHPSDAEFVDPLAYIASIRAEAERFGACKIVPPLGWEPSFSLDRVHFRFKTRVQSVHELQERDSDFEAFEEDYSAWMEATNKSWKGYPMVAGREVDLHKLFRLVTRRGGFDKVTEAKAWREVCRILQVRDKSGNAAYTVRQLYQKHLQQYEEFCANRPVEQKPSVKVPLEELAPKELSKFDKMVAAAGSAEDIDYLGAVAALMDVPASSQELPSRKAKPERLQATSATMKADPIRVPSNIYTLVCELCHGGHHEDKIILCDKCDRGCHLFCLTPPLVDVPEGEWICPLCVSEEADSRAFREGKDYSLDQFERVAQEFKSSWFGGQAAAEKATVADIEAAFWDVVEEGEEPVEVLYGADIDTGVCGSGFALHNSDSSLPEGPSGRYAESPWNLNNLPKLDGSLLRHLDDNIAGVTLPWMYVGMMFSSFCWHIEDHMFYSINYHHWGDAKRWYSVPSSAGSGFEAAFREAMPSIFKKQPDVLFHLVTMLSPRNLQAASVPVFGLVQGPGEFVITFPNAYHSGFNTGLNCAEAVNFAPADWLRFGGASCERYRTFRKPPILSHEWLLLKEVGQHPEGEVAYWAEKDLRRVVAEEREWRCRLRAMGCWQARKVEQEVGMDLGAPEEAECAICRSYVHCSAVECKCCPKRRVCLRHANNLCECPPAAWRLAYRHTLGELQAMLTELSVRIPPGFKEEPAEELSQQPQRASAPSELQEATPCTTVDVPAATSGNPEGLSLLPASKTLSQSPGAGSEEGEPEPGGSSGHSSMEHVEELMTLMGQETYQQQSKPELSDEHVAEPRKRGRKADKGRAAKRRRFEEPEERPRMRLTRAAIKAEEEAQDTMDVLSALAGLADIAEFEADTSPPATPAPPERSSSRQLERRSASVSRDAAKAGITLERQTRHTTVEALVGPSTPAATPPDAKDSAPAADCQPVTKEDYFDVEAALQRMRVEHKEWLERVDALFKKGGARASDIDVLLRKAEQFMWGEDDMQQGVPETVAKLKEAQRWSSKVASFLKNKPTLDELEPFLAWTPAPVAVSGFARLAEGARAARVWLQKVADMEPEQHVAELRAIESLVSEGQRLPILLPPLKALKERMTQARALENSVRDALPVKRVTQDAPILPAPDKMRVRRKREPSREPSQEAAEKTPQPAAAVQIVTLEWLRTLRAHAMMLKVTFPDLDALNRSIAALEDLQARAKEALQLKPPLSMLKSLAMEAENLPATVPEVQKVYRLVADAKAWLSRARNMAQTKVPLKKMRELLHAGVRLGAELPQVEQLRVEIRKREWEDNARKALTNKTNLTALNEVLHDAVAMGAETSELAEGVLLRLQNAHAWEERAAQVLDAPEKPTDDELRRLVQDGNALGIRFERLNAANNMLTAALKWGSQAAQAAQADHTTPPLQRPSLPEVEVLLERYEQLGVTLCEAATLFRKRDQARAWADEANAVLQKPLSEECTADYQRMALEGWSIGLKMEELGRLQDCLAALTWTARVRRCHVRFAEALPTTAEQRSPSATPVQEPGAGKPEAARVTPTVEELATQSDAAMPDAVPSALQPAQENVELGAKQREAPGEAPKYVDSVAASENAEVPVADVRPSGRSLVVADIAVDQLRDHDLPPAQSRGASEQSGSDDGLEAELPGQERLSVEEAQHLVEEGRRLPVNPGLLEGLEASLQRVHDWEVRLESLAPGQKDQERGGIRPEELAPLVEEARGMSLQPESLPALEDALAKASAWQARAARLFQPGACKPLFAEVAAVAAGGRELLVQAEASKRIEAAVVAGEGWRENMRRLMAKRNSGNRLGKCIKMLVAGLEGALEQLDIRMQEEARRAVAAEADVNSPGEGKEGDLAQDTQQEAEYEEDERDLYCVCQQPYNVDTAMISCDACEEWFHCRCIGLTQSAARTIKKYLCPLCAALRGNDRELEAALARTRRTRRPQQESLEAALVEADALSCEMEDAAAIAHSLALFKRWCAAAESAVAGHEQAQAANSLSLGETHGQVTDGAKSGSAEAEPLREAESMEGIELNTSEALETVLSHDVGADLEELLSEEQERRAMPNGTTDEGAARSPGPSRVATEQPAKPRALSVKTLSQLVKSALSLEVECGELQARLMDALRAERWRGRVEAALRSNSKYTMDALCKLLKEGEAAGLDMRQDRVGDKLVARIRACKPWLDEVHTLVQDLVDRGEDKQFVAKGIKRAQALLEEGRAGLGLQQSQLPRGFDKELHRLEEATKLWCLCRQPYNEDRPMLACDYCQDWFHYDCVGLRAPSEDEDDDDVAPKDFKCPSCCRKADVGYPLQDKLPQRSIDTLQPPADSTAVELNPVSQLAAASKDYFADGQQLGQFQALLAPALGGIRPVPQQQSWLLNVLAQQGARLQPSFSKLPVEAFTAGPTTGFQPSCSHPAPPIVEMSSQGPILLAPMQQQAIEVLEADEAL